MKAFITALALALAGPSLAAPATATAADTLINPEAGVPVFAGDISGRPYTVLGEVKAGVRKATIFSGAASEAKIYRELWERGRKLGADAVIKAAHGKSHVNALSWGSTTASGTAIKFTGPGTATVVPAAPVN